MFDFKRAMESALQTHPDDALMPLSTPWGDALDPHAVLQEHPRPQMRRESYANLNGLWECAIAKTSAQEGDEPVFSGEILVPFSPEAPLSRVNHQLMPDESIWYRRSVSLLKRPGMRYLLHFGAVDCECECIVNGYPVGTHRGGYAPFTFDITDALVRIEDIESVATIDLVVRDPSEKGMQPRGKQRLDRGSIWYTAQSGIWQTVWMEEVPRTHIERLDVRCDDSSLSVRVRIANAADLPDAKLSVDVFDEGELVCTKVVEAGGSDELRLRIDMDEPHLWSPDDPHLYDLGVSFGDDAVGSYCAFRTFTIEIPVDASSKIPVFCCNHEPLFLKGVLDQGYWPDGLMTAPSDEALVFDIETAKSLGFNMLRKHAKAEAARWYFHCDRLGMIVWQDLVNGADGDYPALTTSQLPTLLPSYARHVDDTRKLQRFASQSPEMREMWLEEATGLMEHLSSFPCIATWCVFNEGWGQFDANAVVERLREVDDTRLIDQASGWFDRGGGDYVSAHNYFRTLVVPKPRTRHDARARVISEFGGTSLRIPGHSCLERSYGYGACETKEEFDAAVSASLASADALRAHGLSGYVYTQLSDVEEEVNGLVTYDRRVVKYAHGAVCDEQGNEFASSEGPID